jgi:6-pyruvoyltetrahydropterin/6-carboxytetrahydropterin synthase
MQVTLVRDYAFEAAHSLPRVPEHHKCRRMHGHTYKVTITCRGKVGYDGIIFDNALIDYVLKVIVAQLDHVCLNETTLPFAPNPTAENMVMWMYTLASKVPTVGAALHRIDLEEGDRSVFSMEHTDG